MGPLHVCMYAVLTMYTSSIVDVEAGTVDHFISAVNMLRTVNLCGILYMYLGIPPARLVVTRAVPLLLLHLWPAAHSFNIAAVVRGIFRSDLDKTLKKKARK